MQLFQVFSRNNDINGNPYRLVRVHTIMDDSAPIVQYYEARSSRPNIVQVLRQAGGIEIEGAHLAATEYNRLKREAKALGIGVVHVD